jgi:uncharacterized protein YllA (UPF0747 family)
MEDIYLKVIILLITMVGALIGVIYKSIEKSIEKIDSRNNENFGKLERKFDNKFRDLELDVKENNIKIKEIISRQDTEIQLINKQIALLDSEIKYLSRRLNKVEGLDSDHY